MPASARFANFSICAKIVFWFVIALGLLVGLGGTALQRLGAMNTTVQDITVNALSGLRYLGDMRGAFQAYRGAIARELLQADDEAARERSTAEITALEEAYLRNDARYLPTVDAGTEATLHGAIMMAWKNYSARTQHLQELLTAGLVVDAKAYFLGEMLPTATAVDDALRAGIDYNEMSSKAQASDAAANYATGQRSVVVVLGIALVVSGFAVGCLVRSIATPIAALTAVMRRLAAQDMAVEIPVHHRTDEVGQMVEAVQVFKDVMIRSRAQAELIEATLESMEQGLAAFDAEGIVVCANSRFRTMHVLPAELCAPGRHILDLTRFAAVRGDYGPGDPEALAQARWQAAAGGSLFRSSSVGPNGSIFEVTGRPLQGGGFVNTYTDVTEARAAEATLRKEEARYRLLAEQLARQNADLELAQRRFNAVLDNVSQGVNFLDSDQRLIVCNRRYREIYHLSPQQAQPGTTLAAVFDHRQAAGSFPKATATDYTAQCEALWKSGRPFDMITELRDGRILSLHAEPLADGSLVTTHEDITARRRAEAHLVFVAHHDALTQLPNRALFNERLEQALDMAGRGSGCAVLCLDLDRFKLINDTLGHPVGDGLLKAVADRLQACVREVDTVARLGGDEFAIIQLAVERPDEAELLANRIIAALRHPFDIEGNQLVIGASIGIAMAPGDGTSARKLLKNADIALYLVKIEGRNAARFFEPEMDARIQLRRTLELDLRGAIARNEFEIYYQPLINLAAGRVSAFEALLRWHHPIRGLVSPTDFIPLAEETGLIVEIGEWVLRTACLEALNWPSEVSVAVNLSPVQFRSGSVAATVREALEASGLRPEQLEIEITESVLLQHTVGTLTELHQLRAMGIAVALDDFGTGYSSLSYLRSFPFDKIKIDQSFVQEMNKKEVMSIVRAVTGLGESLYMKTTAEGVETAEQLDKLREEGCTEVQGNFYSRPRPASEVLLLIENLNSRITKSVPDLISS